MAVRIMIADDDQDLIEGLRWYLEAESFEIIAAPDGETAVETFRRERPEIVVLDVMMPKLDGIKVCEIVSNESDAMILMLSARDEEIDKVRALKLGADDYVTKPFHVSELVARIQSLVRRRRRTQGSVPAFQWKNLQLFPEERRVRVNDSAVELTAMEFDLLASLMASPQVVQARERLVADIWGDDFYGEMRLVDNLVYRLRDKLAGAGCCDFPIVTVRGVGYVFRP